MMEKEDFEFIDKVALEHFKDGKIVSRCPKCDGEMIVKEIGNSYEVKYINGCISEGFRGI